MKVLKLKKEGVDKLQNNMFRRSLVCGMFLLFIGLSITSSISGYIGKMSGQSTEEIPTNFPLNDDYVNAYWKFDTGSGNIAYDSSGNDFDGTIQGATWTTHTPSGSDYALDFDGVSDYVNLDSHAGGLGLNKTDDLIFSFWFKSAPTDTGMIYSMSTGSGSNPELHIFLNFNGTIGFKVRVTSCGFTLYSNNLYNDDDWHYVEIWYNGITCEPTVTIYVDDEFDNNITYWVCPFTNDEFTRTKIGRRSHNETDYFDGIIDEFKIIKYAGGNKQSPPEISGPNSGDPGEELEFTFVTNDPEGDDIWLHIEWGDGEVEEWIGPYESGEEVIVSHTWDENGTYTIRAKSKDVWDNSHSTYYQVLIGNQAPYAPTITGPQFGDPEVEYEYTFVTEDPEAQDICYKINWGDGNITNWIGPKESGKEITRSHSWSENGTYEIKAKAKDINGAESDWSTYPVRIGNKAPYAPTITGQTNGKVGVEYEYTFVTIDLDGDDVYYDEIDWGDSTKDTDLGPYESGEEVSLKHTWSHKGEYTIEARARDSLGAFSDWGTLKVTMPKNKAFNFNFNLLSWLFEHFPNAFPILRQLLVQ